MYGGNAGRAAPRLRLFVGSQDVRRIWFGEFGDQGRCLRPHSPDVGPDPWASGFPACPRATHPSLLSSAVAILRESGRPAFRRCHRASTGQDKRVFATNRESRRRGHEPRNRLIGSAMVMSNTRSRRDHPGRESYVKPSGNSSRRSTTTRDSASELILPTHLLFRIHQNHEERRRNRDESHSITGTWRPGEARL